MSLIVDVDDFDDDDDDDVLLCYMGVSSNGSNNRIQLFLTPWNQNEVRETARMKTKKYI